MNFYNFTFEFKKILFENIENKNEVGSYLLDLMKFLDRKQFVFDKDFSINEVYKVLNEFYDTKLKGSKALTKAISNVKKYNKTFPNDFLSSKVIHFLEELQLRLKGFYLVEIERYILNKKEEEQEENSKDFFSSLKKYIKTYNDDLSIKIEEELSKVNLKKIEELIVNKDKVIENLKTFFYEFYKKEKNVITLDEIKKEIFNFLKKYATEFDVEDMALKILPEMQNEIYISSIKEACVDKQYYSLKATFVKENSKKDLANNNKLSILTLKWKDENGNMFFTSDIIQKYKVPKYDEGEKFLLLIQYKQDKPFSLKNKIKTNEIFMFPKFGSTTDFNRMNTNLELLVENYMDTEIKDDFLKFIGKKGVLEEESKNKDILFKNLKIHKTKSFIHRYIKEEKYWFDRKTNYDFSDIDEIKKEIILAIGKKLTPEQEKTIETFNNGLRTNTPLEIILQGDVGTGKTFMFLYFSLLLAKKGLKSFIILPTIIIQNQVYKEAMELGEKLGIEISTVIQKNNKSKLTNPNAIIFIGSVGLVNFQDEIKPNCMVFDESQRYGMITKKKSFDLDYYIYSSATIEPHLELNKKIKKFDNFMIIEMYQRFVIIEPQTFVINTSKEIITLIIEILEKEKKVLFIINNKQRCDKSVEYFKELFKEMNLDYRVESLYEGKKKAIEIVEEFNDKRINLLIATTIVECGLNSHNLQNTIVEADNLSLSSIWQIKGRNARDSSCTYNHFYIYNKSQNVFENKIKDFIECKNGVEVAELDAKIRGYGNIVLENGVTQKGGNIFSDLLNEFSKEEINLICSKI